MSLMEEIINTPKELQEELGQGIRTLRIRRRLTQKDLAAQAGIFHKSLANLERGTGSTVETLVRILNALGATHVIKNLAPEPQISPLALLQSSKVPQRVRYRRRSGDKP